MKVRKKSLAAINREIAKKRDFLDMVHAARQAARGYTTVPVIKTHNHQCENEHKDTTESFLQVRPLAPHVRFPRTAFERPAGGSDRPSTTAVSGLDKRHVLEARHYVE